jgi:ribosome-binding factor A
MFERSERLKELFHEEIVLALKGVKDPGVAGFMTVTDVQLSTDRKTVKVFYSILGDPRQQKSTAKALERSAPYLRHVLRKRLSIKVIPQVVFEYDDTPKKASRIDKLLLDLEKEQGA